MVPEDPFVERQPPLVPVTLYFKSHFCDLVGCNQANVYFQSWEVEDNSLKVKQVLDRFLSSLGDTDVARVERHCVGGIARVREALYQALVVWGTHILNLNDRIPAGSELVILPPLAGGTYWRW